MKKTKNLAVVLAAAVAICFALVSLLQSAPPPHANNPGPEPIWEITEANWVDHAPNPRFAIWDVEDDNDTTEEDRLLNDLVLDKETGLVWTRDANPFSEPLLPSPRNWASAMYSTRNLGEDFSLGLRNGWRVATVEEFGTIHALASPSLPPNHPFENVVIGHDSPPNIYWTSTTAEDDSTKAYAIEFQLPKVWKKDKIEECYVWPVRGGTGYATANW
jgi:hypothetical protein